MLREKETYGILLVDATHATIATLTRRENKIEIERQLKEVNDNTYRI
jgi:peptide subunit release factor 1 (eRF1)